MVTNSWHYPTYTITHDHHRRGEMSVLTIVGLIPAVINPVIGRVLEGHLLWLDDKDTGFQIIVLAFFASGVMVIARVCWPGRHEDTAFGED